MRFIDLSHTIRNGMQTYPGLPVPVISEYLSRKESASRYAEGTTFHIGRIDMVTNTGTYIDSPFHRYDGGADIAHLPLGLVADLPGIVIRVRNQEGREINADHLERADLVGRAVLIDTGWSDRWGREDYFSGHPFLSTAAAELLIERGAALVGVDTLNVDSTDQPDRPVHSLLLGAQIPIIEHMTNLDQVPAHGFRFFAVPPPFEGVGSFPVRAFALIDG